MRLPGFVVPEKARDIRLEALGSDRLEFILHAGGAEVLDEREEHDFGRFGWFTDPDGNRVELWEPPKAE